MKTLFFCVWNERKIKTLRLAIAIIKNFVQNNQENILKLLRYEIQDKIKNLDIPKDEKEMLIEVKVILECIDKCMQRISNFDEYKAELKSGELDWTPWHKSNLFWKNYATKLEEDKGECLQILLDLIENSLDVKTKIIAINDIQNYIINRSNSKR